MTLRSERHCVELAADANHGCLVNTIRLVLCATKHEGKSLSWSNFIPFTIPAWMYLMGGLPIHWTIAVWLLTLIPASLFFVLYGLTAGHHSHRNFFEGDIPRCHADNNGCQRQIIMCGHGLGFRTRPGRDAGISVKIRISPSEVLYLFMANTTNTPGTRPLVLFKEWRCSLVDAAAVVARMSPVITQSRKSGSQ
ncbi:hypothetical protein PYW08_005935 [Mythimna loreyi]|uniref:Uncharacterized protein n=1 Tax=Mythimna loreyi TaxID=667449 RepID=A0ACC2QJ63_9NEOP|nr:hypothetical protein PYW08_005935 [Mythimna loreyi]